MNSIHSRSIRVGASLFALLGAAAMRGQNYTAVTIAPAGFTSIQLVAINDDGQILANAVPTNDTYQPVILTGSGSTVIRTTSLGGYQAFGNTLNNLGHVGGSYLVAGGNTPGFVFNGSGVTRTADLESREFNVGTTVRAMNDSGQIAGESALGGSTRAFVGTTGSITAVPTLGGSYNTASAINASGWVVGNSTFSGDSVEQGFLYADSVVRPIGVLAGGQYSSARDINNHGDVVGASSTGADETHAVLFRDGNLYDLSFGTDVTYSAASSINDARQVIGAMSVDYGSGYSSFLYSEGVMRDLNTLLAAPLEQLAVRDINIFGQIVGTYWNPTSSTTEAVLLNPNAGFWIAGGGATKNFHDASGWKFGVPAEDVTIKLWTGESTMLVTDSLTQRRLVSAMGGTHTVDLGTTILKLGENLDVTDRVALDVSNGDLTLKDGFTVEVTGHAVVGSANALGKLTLDGTVMTITDPATGILGMNVGNGGDGELLFKNASAMTITGMLAVGAEHAATGKVVVDESSSLAATLIRVGYDGVGSLEFKNDSLGSASGVELGSQADGIGALMVRGAGTRFEVDSGYAHIGGLGRGDLTVTSGAVVDWGASLVSIENGASGSHSTLRIDSLGASNEGSFAVGRGGRLEVVDFGVLVSEAGGVEVTAQGALEVRNGSVQVNLMSINGSANITAGSTVAIATTFTVGSSGSVRITGDSTVSAADVFVNGALKIDSGGSLVATSITLLDGARVSGNGGTIDGNVFHVGGEIAPGNSPGTLTINGNYTLGALANLTLEVGGTNAGTSYDRFVVTGDFAIESGGAVVFSFINGFAPTTGEVFEFFDVDGSVSGAANFVVSGLESGWLYTAELNAAGGLTLTALSDGVATTSAIPEPSTWAVIVGAAAMGLTVWNRRQRQIARD